MSIKISNLYKSYGDNTIYNNFSISFPSEGIYTLTGPSGCGKTTLFNIISGIDNDYKGSVIINRNSKISVVFQEDRLLPWFNAEKNISIVNTEMDKAEINKILHLLDLDGTNDKYPDELSGGMKRRIAIARALAYSGDIYLLDEPFKGLDQKIKTKLIEYFEQLGRTKLILHITHELSEVKELKSNLIKMQP